MYYVCDWTSTSFADKYTRLSGSDNVCGACIWNLICNIKVNFQLCFCQAAATCRSVCAGAQKELDQWPLFQELLSLLPYQSIHITFVSPEVPCHLDSAQRTRILQQGCTSGAPETAATSSADTVTGATERQWAAPGIQSANYTESAADQIQDCQSTVHVSAQSAKSLHQGSTVPSENAPRQAHTDMGSSDLPTLKVSFHKGFYHDVTVDSNQQLEAADLVFGANAGRAICLRGHADRLCFVVARQYCVADSVKYGRNRSFTQCTCKMMAVLSV